MADEGTSEGNETGAGTGETPAWVAQLPASLKDNEAFTSFETLGDFGESFLELRGKASELDGIKGQLEKAIFKPGEDATPEDKAAYRTVMNVPETAEGYEFPKTEGQENSPEMIEWAQKVFHEAGISREAAEHIGGNWNAFVKSMTDADTAAKAELKTKADTALKTEWGANYDKNLELTKRGWKHCTDTDFDTFCEETGVGNDARLVKFVHKVGVTMGEDFSPPGSQQQGTKTEPGIIYDKSPAPPAT